jgi:hypothetical protein
VENNNPDPSPGPSDEPQSQPSDKPQSKPTYEIPRLTDDEIKTVAADLVKGRIFTANDCPPDQITVLFFPLLALMSEGQLNWDDIGMIYEYMDKAAPMGVNGLPFFFTCRIVNKEDWGKIGDRALKIHNAMQEAMQ